MKRNISPRSMKRSIIRKIIIKKCKFKIKKFNTLIKIKILKGYKQQLPFNTKDVFFEITVVLMNCLSKKSYLISNFYSISTRIMVY